MMKRNPKIFRVSFPESTSTVMNESTEVRTSSEICTVKGSYVWRIQNFDWLHLRQAGVIESEIFHTNPTDELTWRMSIKLFCYKAGDVLRTKVILQDTNKQVNVTSFSMCILDVNDAQTTDGYMATLFRSKKACSAVCAISRDFLMLHSDSLMPNGNLKILCQIKRRMKLSKSGIARDLGHFFESSKMCDVKLIVNKVEFRAHKIVLASRSPVFASMFRSNTIENETNEVKISDIEPEIIKELLRFIYTEEVEKLNVLCLELFCAADRFGLDDLRLLCEDALCNSIDVENAVSLLIYADMHESKRLKSVARDFIDKNAEAIIQTTGYKALNDRHRNLLIEIPLLNK